jgi:DNA polymerase-1|nr:MAG TPA: Exodeoxyribonuclease [Bacteriophage sp.]
MSKEPLKILFDADMVVFRATSSVETPIHWGNDLWTLHADAGEAQAKVDETILSLTEKVLKHYKYEGKYEIIMCFSDTNNFRMKILPTYKINRADKRKPVCYYAVKQWVEANYTCYQRPGLEADDCIGILATLKANTVIISGDKDFKTIPGRFYDFLRNEFYDITTEQANYWHLYQTLIGDVTDNYKGCPGMGPVSAQKLLDKEGATWATVVSAFEKKGLTEKDALVQARVARILRASDYDFKTKQPIIWHP